MATGGYKIAILSVCALMLILVWVLLFLPRVVPVNLRRAIEDHDVAQVRGAIERRQTVNVRFALGKREEVTPLMIATESGNIEIVRMLLEAGANVDAANSLGETALFYAVQNRNHEIFKILIENDANPWIRASADRSILALACGLVGNAAIVRLLLSNESGIEISDEDWSYCLQAAASNDNLEVIEILIKEARGVNLYANGRTPLHCAVKWGSPDCAALLISAGAEINAIDQIGDTPLHYAIAREDLPMVRLLIQNGANTQIMNSGGHLPISRASSEKRDEIMRMLESENN